MPTKGSTVVPRCDPRCKYNRRADIGNFLGNISPLLYSRSPLFHIIMAPDLNAVAAGDRFDYSQPGSAGYNIDQNTTWMDPNNRKLRVLTVGGGVTGILMAYQIQKYCENVDHVIYEKNDDIGGTWLVSFEEMWVNVVTTQDTC